MDRLSGAFEQGKVYVTVDKSASNESLKLLCEKLKKHYRIVNILPVIGQLRSCAHKQYQQRHWQHNVLKKYMSEL